MDWGSEESIVQRPNGQVRSFRGPPSPPSFSTGPWSSCIVTGHDQSMHCPFFSRPSQMQCMQRSALPSTCSRVRSSKSACGLPEVFHVSPRSRSIARVGLRRWCDHACDRSQVFRLQANDAIYCLLEVLPFIPDTQQVQAERFSSIYTVCVSGIKLLFHHATNRDQVCFCRQVSTW